MNKDIFNNTIIKYQDIEDNLVQIFTDSIITDTQYRIIDISDSVVGMLKYKKSQVIGRHISEVLYGNSSDLILLLNRQYFGHAEFSLKDSLGNEIEVFFSGYFLGLISDFNGKIIILVKNRKDFFLEKKKLEKRLLELNELIYRTSHDLRGPLATIKGLALTAQNENDFTLTHKYFELINQVADKLDLTLQYLRESLNKKNYQCELINIHSLVEEITERIQKLGKVYELNIDLKIQDGLSNFTFISNQFLASALIENLILVVESLREVKGESYTLHISANRNEIKIMVESKKVCSIISQYLPGKFKYSEMRHLISKSGYSYLNLKILKICREIIKARITLDKGMDSQILITIPSQPILINNSI